MKKSNKNISAEINAFSEELEEQLKEIKNSFEVRNLIDLRKEHKNDPHNPIYHFYAPNNLLNDPNGFCFWENKWHLFYQAYPNESPCYAHWGHAISEDLIHWHDLPIAIYPGPEKESYSGGALVEKDRVIATYHGVGVGNMLAISKDPLLLKWEKLTDNPVIPFAKENETPLPYGIYDPCIWKKENSYYCLNGGTLPHPNSENHIRGNFLFRSKDLISWEYLHQFVEGDFFTRVGDDGSCPYFFPIGDQHILLFYSHMSGGQYLLGEYDKNKDKFHSKSHGLFNFGPSNPCGVHAPSAIPDGKGGIVVIFNMNPGNKNEYKDDYVNKYWGQIMTLPRRLNLNEKNQLSIEPAGDIESLRFNKKKIGRMILPANQEVVLNEIKGTSMELFLEFNHRDSPMIEINVLRSPNKEEFTRISFFNKRGFKYQKSVPNNNKSVNVMSSALAELVRHESVLSIDTSYSSILPGVLSRAPESAPVSIGEKELIQMRIFIDKSVLEVFINSLQCISVRVYPSLKESNGVSLKSQGKNAELINLYSWQMKNIY